MEAHRLPRSHAATVKTRAPRSQSNRGRRFPTRSRRSSRWSRRAPVSSTRIVRLGARMTFHGHNWLINDEQHHHDAPVKVGELQVWDIVNETGMDHPFHLHGFCRDAVLADAHCRGARSRGTRRRSDARAAPDDDDEAPCRDRRRQSRDQQPSLPAPPPPRRSIDRCITCSGCSTPLDLTVDLCHVQFRRSVDYQCQTRVRIRIARLVIAHSAAGDF